MGDRAYRGEVGRTRALLGTGIGSVLLAACTTDPPPGAVEAPEPPFLLLLGRDAAEGFRGVRDAERAELEAWQETTLGTDFRD